MTTTTTPPAAAPVQRCNLPTPDGLRCGLVAHGADTPHAPFDAAAYFAALGSGEPVYDADQLTSRERYDVRQVDGNGFVAYSRAVREAERLAELLRGRLSLATLATLHQVTVGDEAPKWAREALALLDDRLRPLVAALTDASGAALCYDVASGEVTALRSGGSSPKLVEQMRREIDARRKADAMHVFPCLCDDCVMPGGAPSPSAPAATADAAARVHAQAWVQKADREREDELHAKYGGGAWARVACPKCRHRWAWRTEVASSDHGDARYECGACRHVWVEDGADG